MQSVSPHEILEKRAPQRYISDGEFVVTRRSVFTHNFHMHLALGEC